MKPIPTLKELFDGIVSDLNSSLNITIPFFGKSFLRALAGVQAAKLKIFYLQLGNIQRNIFVDTADPESSGGTLERFGRVKINRDPFNARAGQYNATVTGSIGAVVPASSVFKSDDTSLNPGILYVLDTPHTMVTTSDSIILRALTSGIEGRLNVGDTLTVTAPIANINKTATIISTEVDPLAAEEIEDYRSKVIDSYRLEPQGGAPTDYRLWAQDAQGVKETYPYAKSGFSNEIDLYVEAVISDSIDGKGTPSPSLLADVEEVIEFSPDSSLPILERGRRPLGVFQVHYLPVNIRNVDINISGYVGNTVAIQASILTALSLLIDSIRPFVSAADILENKNDIMDVNKVSYTIQVAKPASVFGTITMKIDGVDLPSFQFVGGDIPYLNSVTYV